MTEAEARAWVRQRFGVSRETMMDRLVAMVVAESERQNLVAKSTLDTIWARHIVDSAQLLRFADDAGKRGVWLDIGSGAGFPGIVAAVLQDRPVRLVEPRRRRAVFLSEAIESLGLSAQVAIDACRVETLTIDRPAAIISARAVAALPALFAAAAHCADRNTVWLLPKGRSAQSEVEAARGAWQGSFHMEPSITRSDSHIVVAREVRRR